MDVFHKIVKATLGPIKMDLFFKHVHRTTMKILGFGGEMSFFLFYAKRNYIIMDGKAVIVTLEKLKYFNHCQPLLVPWLDATK